MKVNWQEQAKALDRAGFSMLEISQQVGVDVGFVAALLKPHLGRDKSAGYRAQNRKKFTRRK